MAEETPSDQVSSKIQAAGPGGFTRLIFEQNQQVSNYSIQPNSNHQNFTSVLPVCVDATDSECIESLSFRKLGDQNWIQGKLLPTKNPNMNGITAVTYSNTGTTQSYGPVVRNIELARPRGDMSSNWELTEAKHSGGNEYLLSASVFGSTEGFPNSTYEFSIKLNAVQWKVPPAFGLYDKTANSTSQFNLPKNIEFQVKIRLGFIENKITNWYNGRILDPTIELENGLLTISGLPSYFPIAGTKYVKCSDLAGERKLVITDTFGPDTLNGSMCNDLSGSAYMFSPKNQQAFKAFDAWSSEITEYGKNSAWSIEASSNLGVCKSPELAGFVSSNALLYTVDPPAFNQTTKTLSYRIASTHLDSKGEVNRGRFNLVISRKVAECLWGLSPQNLADAKVEVTYSDGTPIIGTSSMSVKSDWVYINIENFSFSSPTFNIKAVSQTNLQPTPATSASPSPSASKNTAQTLIKKTSITCVKGKQTKKVTAISPKCPAGYKKK